MKAIINCSTPKCEWPTEYFEGINPYMLPVLGRPLIEYYLDFLAISGIQEVLIVWEDYDEDAVHILGDGSRWGIKLEYTVCSGDCISQDVVSKNTVFADGDQVLFLDGFFFPLYDKDARKIPMLPKDWQKIRIMGGKVEDALDLCPCREIKIPSLTAYYDLNMSLLSTSSGCLILKSYSTEPGVFMGMNDIIMRSARLTAPFIIGNNSQVEVGAQVGPNSIVGDTCIIDKNTVLTRTMIFDKTYIGADLDMNGKIIWGNYIIDPVAGVKVQFSDSFFTSAMREGAVPRAIRRLFEIPLCLLLAAYMTPFYLLFKIFGLPKYDHFRCSCPKNGKSMSFYLRRYPYAKGFRYALFFKLGLDKYAGLLQVLNGNLDLIGDSAWDCDTEEQNLKRYKQYAPGLFTYADSLLHVNSFEKLIDDLYYKHNRTLKTDLQLILRTFVGRFFAGAPHE